MTIVVSEFMLKASFGEMMSDEPRPGSQGAGLIVACWWLISAARSASWSQSGLLQCPEIAQIVKIVNAASITADVILTQLYGR